MVLQLEVRRSATAHSTKPSLGLDEKDLALVLQSADFRKTDSPLKYLLLRDKGEAWLVVELVQKSPDENSLVFSLSQTNPYFDQVLSDTFQATQKLANLLGAGLYEWRSGQVIGPEFFGAIEDPDNTSLRSLIFQWEQTLNYINAENKAPAEFFVNNEEFPHEYFCLQLHLNHPLKFEDLIDKVGFSIRAKNDSQCAIYDKNTQRPLCKLFLHSSGVLQIQPFYWKVGFAQAASETIQTAQLLQVLIDPLAQLSFFQFPLTPALLNDIEATRSSFGLDFNKWAQSYFGSQWGSRQILHRTEGEGSQLD